jgi:hypothetical protein
MSNVKSPFSSIKWEFVVATSIAIIGIIVSISIPEVRCFVGFKAEACATQLKTVELLFQTEKGESLGGVRVQVNSSGASEIQWSDDNGYVKARIPSEGDVRINLSKEGYPTQNFTINLENEQSTNRIIRLKKDGKPDVKPA